VTAAVGGNMYYRQNGVFKGPFKVRSQ